MKRFTSRPPRIALAAAALLMLGGCVYGPGYYPRSNVVYDDGRVASGPAYSDGYYSDGYYASPGYYGPSYYYGAGYGPGYYWDPWWPAIGLGFYGSYYFGGHHGHGGSGHHGGGGHHGH